jgi:hypothetical protein
MATRKWAGTWTSRGNVLTTELNSLADVAFSGVGTELDNTANLDEFAIAQIDLASLNPTTGAFLQLFVAVAPDGTNYDDAPSSTNPGSHQLVATVALQTGSATKRVVTKPFKLPPTKMKFVLKNESNVALAAASNTVKVYTNNLATA